MSAIGPKQTWMSALHMSAFGGKADMLFGVANLQKFFCIYVMVIKDCGTGERCCPVVVEAGIVACAAVLLLVAFL